MELNAFNARLGMSQGHMQDDDANVFVLGDDNPGYFHEIEPGDHADVVQETDLTDVDFIRAEVAFRVPEGSLPSDYFWTVAIVLDGTTYCRATCLPGRERRITDLAANVSKMTGMHWVGVRLELWEDEGEG